jgi:tetratricopeptide (TPR) repeat protein
MHGAMGKPQGRIIGEMMKQFILLLLVVSLWGCMENKGGAQKFFNEGASFAHKGDFTSAIKKYQKGLALAPNNPVGHNLLGMAYRFRFNQTGTQEYKEKEIAAFKKAIELDPKFWVACKNLAASLYYQGRKKDAVSYAQKALELQPNDPEKALLLQWIKEGQAQPDQPKRTAPAAK